MNNSKKGAAQTTPIALKKAPASALNSARSPRGLPDSAQGGKTSAKIPQAEGVFKIYRPPLDLN